jgi:hypothetical protein
MLDGRLRPRTAADGYGPGIIPGTAINIVHGKYCRIGGTLSLDDLAETSEIGDWQIGSQ